jgi:hypothetical protein
VLLGPADAHYKFTAVDTSSYEKKEKNSEIGKADERK